MGGFVTAGMAGQLVTVGLGGTVSVVLVQQPQGGGSLHHKKRVQAITLTSSQPIVILDYITVESENVLTIFDLFKIPKEAIVKIKEAIEMKFDNPTEFHISIVKKMGNKVEFIEHLASKSSHLIRLPLEKIVTKVSKLVDIMEAEHIKKSGEAKILNTDDIIKDIDKVELIKMLEEIDRFEKRTIKTCEDCGLPPDECECTDCDCDE